MPEYHNIDFEHAATLMDVVQKVANVSSAYTALSGVAMMELKEMNQEAQAYLSELGKERLKAEQDAAAELNRKNQAAAEKQQRIDAVNAKRNALPRPVTIMPGEPVPTKVQVAAGDVEPPEEDQNLDGIADQQETDTPQFPDEPSADTKPVARRV